MYKNEHVEYDPVQMQNYQNQMQSSYNMNNFRNNSSHNLNRIENLKQINCSQNENSQKINNNDNLQVSQPASENYTKLIIDSLCENEKAYRSIQMNLKIETMRKDLLLTQLEQKKRNIENLKSEIKKIRATLEKLKDQTNVVSRENEFLHDMIEFTAKEEYM